MNRGILDDVMDIFWVNALWSLAPTVLVGLIFWVIMRAIIRSDRDERAAYAKVEATERARLGLPPADTRAQAESPEVANGSLRTDG